MSTQRVGYIWYGALVMKWIHTNIKTHNHMRQEEVRLGVAKIDSFLICVLKKENEGKKGGKGRGGEREREGKKKQH